jgi:hypothetical protein
MVDMFDHPLAKIFSCRGISTLSLYGNGQYRLFPPFAGKRDLLAVIWAGKMSVMRV